MFGSAREHTSTFILLRGQNKCGKWLQYKLKERSLGQENFYFVDIKWYPHGAAVKNKHLLREGRMCHSRLPLSQLISTWQLHWADGSRRHDGVMCAVHGETTHLPCEAAVLHSHCSANRHRRQSLFATTASGVQLGPHYHNLSLHLIIYANNQCFFFTNRRSTTCFSSCIILKSSIEELALLVYLKPKNFSLPHVCLVMSYQQ